MRKIGVIFEYAGENFSAYSPDLPGCVATGATIADVRANIIEAIRFHLEGLNESSTEFEIKSVIEDPSLTLQEPLALQKSLQEIAASFGAAWLNSSRAAEIAEFTQSLPLDVTPPKRIASGVTTGTE